MKAVRKQWRGFVLGRSIFVLDPNPLKTNDVFDVLGVLGFILINTKIGGA